MEAIPAHLGTAPGARTLAGTIQLEQEQTERTEAEDRGIRHFSMTVGRSPFDERNSPTTKQGFASASLRRTMLAIRLLDKLCGGTGSFAQFAELVPGKVVETAGRF